MKRRLLLLTPLLWVGGCAVMALTLDKPEVSFAAVEVLGGNLAEQQLRITLRVTNPNDRAIEITSVGFILDLNGAEFARGAGRSPVSLPARGEIMVPLLATSSLAEIFRAAPKMMEGDGSLSYRLRGEVVTRDYGSLPFDRSSTLSAADLLKHLNKKPRKAVM